MAEMSYKDKFAKALKDSGKSLADMSDDEKKKFFNKVDSMHSAKNEEVELEEMKKMNAIFWNVSPLIFKNF